MYNMLEFSSNYSDTTVSLWFYSKDEAIDFNNAFSNTDYFDFFRYKNRLVQATAAGNLENVTTAVPLKYLSNFCRSRDVSSLTVYLLCFINLSYKSIIDYFRCTFII